MKYAKLRKPVFDNTVKLDLASIFDCIGPFDESLSDLIYNYDQLYDDEDYVEPQELPTEIEKEIQRLSAIAQAQLVPSSMPRDSWASGVGLGLLRQNIAKELEGYWRKNGEFPSGALRLDGHRLVLLPDRNSEES